MTVDLYHRLLPADEAAGGSATPVIFLGALGTDTTMWPIDNPEFAGVLRGRPVCLVDHRGHGRSPVPAQAAWTIADMAADVRALLDRLGWDVAHVVGISIGGAVAQQIAIDYPHRVASVTLVATATSFGSPKAWQDKARLVEDHSTAAVANDCAARWITDDYEATVPVRQRFAAMVQHCPDAGYAGCCRALSSFDSSQQLHRITQPALVVGGSFDPGTPQAAVEKLASGLPQLTRLVMLPTAHMVAEQAPGALSALITKHLESVDSVSSLRDR